MLNGALQVTFALFGIFIDSFPGRPIQWKGH
jgi:hypothetical protein